MSCFGILSNIYIILLLVYYLYVGFIGFGICSVRMVRMELHLHRVLLPVRTRRRGIPRILVRIIVRSHGAKQLSAPERSQQQAGHSQWRIDWVVLLLLL
jgi:hypothetical protein